MRDDLLLCFLELWLIAHDDLFGRMSEREPLDMDCLETIPHHTLIAEDLARDIDESSEFSLEEFASFLIEREHTIFDPIEIALDCCDGSTDLMREVREEVRTDLLLDREGLMEIVDGLDEWLEFIFLHISYGCKRLTSDNLLEILDDRLDRDEYRAYPEIVDHEDEDEPDYIDDEKVFENIGHEYSLRCIISEGSEIEWEKEFPEIYIS